MIEMKGNIWDFYRKDPEAYICITTNGFVKNNGECVMGAGVAKEAKEKFKGLAKNLGSLIKENGNNVYMFSDLRIFSFPTKHIWSENSDIKLIKKSAEQLMKYLENYKVPRIYLPRPGCGNGKLKWKDVRPIIENILDDRILIVSKEFVNDKI